MTVRLSLEQCGERRLLHSVAAGRYSIEYNDSTHTAEDEWLKLGEVDVRGSVLEVADDGIEQFYTVECEPGPLPALPNNAVDRRIRTLKDTFALTLGRVGLLTPQISEDLRTDLLELDAEDGVVIIPDTNALHNGAVHWLLRVLRGPSVWLMPVVASLTTVQTRDAMVKELVGKRTPGKLVQALRSRGLVNGTLGLLQRNRGRSQVAEIDPSLLRYQKQASSSGMDPDQSDVLEDRLIIEGIHGVLRSMRSRSARRVVTSDVNIARVLEAEGIRTLFIPTIVLPEGPIACLRFDALARSFVGAPLRALLWELTHVFGSVRLKKADGYELVRLECYWAAKTPAQWSNEILAATFATSASDVPSVAADVAVAQSDVSLDRAPAWETQGAGERAPDHDPETSAAPHVGDRLTGPLEVGTVSGTRLSGAEAPAAAEPVRTEEGARRSRVRAKAKPRTSAAMGEIGVVLPRASLPQAFTLLAAARRLGPASAERITAASAKEPITVDNARRALEIMRRADLLRQTGDIYSATPTVDSLDKALAKNDLDAVSSMMTRFEPYARLMELLRRDGSVPRAEVAVRLREALGKVGSYESERLPRYHVLLGQAWLTGDAIMDGSQRPTDRDATDAFDMAFEASASDGIASVIDLLRVFCERTRMSPWASKRRIEGFVRQNLLSDYSFQTAAGRRPITGEPVLAGSLDTLVLEPVVIDRLQLGQRPVFTVERTAR